MDQFFWRGSNCTESKFEAGRAFYSCLESNLEADYLKLAWKLEGLSESFRKIQKTFIKQNVFSRIVFLRKERTLVSME